MAEASGITRSDVEAAEAETARKLAADREADLESLSPYASAALAPRRDSLT